MDSDESIEEYVDRIIRDADLRECMRDDEIRELRRFMVAGLRRRPEIAGTAEQ
ncbi:MAG: hypothetical protein WD795_00615 [Woeseia sp.]